MRRYAASTSHVVSIIIPNNRKNQFNRYMQDLYGGDDWFSVPLSASGNLPATHWGCTGLMGAVPLARVMKRVADLAKLSEQPDDWEKWSRERRQKWVKDNESEVRSKVTIRMRLDDPDGPKDRLEQLMAEANLQRIVGKIGG